MDHRHSGSSSDSFGLFCVVCSLGDQRQRIRERGSDGLYSKISGGMNMINLRFGSVDKVVLPVPDKPKKIAELVPSIFVLAEQCICRAEFDPFAGCL